MNLQLTPFNEILRHINEEILPFLGDPVPEDPEVITGRGNIVHSYISILTKYLADAKYYRDVKTYETIRDNKKEVAQVVMRPYCESLCHTENFLVNIIEGQLKKCYSEIDWLRTLISKAKEELRTFTR